MPKRIGRGSTVALDELHGLVTKAIARDMRAALKSTEPVPTALLRAAQEHLKLTDVRDPARDRKAKDALADTMPDFSDDLPAPPVAPTTASPRVTSGPDTLAGCMPDFDP